MEKTHFKKILLVSAHPDDIEYGMGGTLYKLCKGKRAKIKVIIFADCEEQPGNKGITKEFKRSMRFFDIINYKLYDFPNTKLLEHSSQIREQLEKCKNSFGPDLVFSTSKNSIHQDHEYVSLEVERVFRNISFLTFEDIKSSPYFSPNFFSLLNESYIKNKLEALSLYKTQYRRYYHDEELIKSLARFRGGQVGCKYAEAFEVIRYIL